MSIKKVLIISYAVITIGIIALGILGVIMKQNEEMLNEKHEGRYQSYLLADQLRQSSDELTRLARTYVVTGDSKYEKMYWHILDIRNGKKPRPEYYDRIYWDLVLEYGMKPRPDGETKSLESLMKEAGFTEAEFAKLREAQNNSDGLVTTETIAMNAVKGLYDDGKGNYTKKGEPDLDLARRIMYDAQYHQDKASIMQPIDVFFKLLNERTRAEVDYHVVKGNLLIIIIQAIAVILAILAVGIGIFVTRRILEQVGGEPDKIAKITNQVANGKLDIVFESAGKAATGIYAAVQIMVKNLKSINSEREAQDWLKTGQARLSEQTSGEQHIKQLAENVINFLAPYVGAQVGAFYLLEGKEEQRLRMIASHAYVWRKNAANTFELGEGIIGQAGFEQKMFIVTKAPEDYIHIRSGLGESAPSAILVTPFLYENALKGVIELASFEMFSETQLEFLKQAMPAISIAVNTAESRTKMQALLEQSQTQSEELRIQQEKTQQTNEELQKQSEEMRIQQEKLRQNNEELQAQSEEMQSQQEELRQTNEELEMRTRDLEKERAGIRTKNQELEKTRQAIQIKAEELELASKYKSEFLANMSHELRTPLNSLLILAQLLADNKENNLSGQQVECAQTIYSAGTDLLTLINEILDLSKVEAGKITVNPEEVSIAKLTESLVQKFRPMAEKKSITFTINVAENLPQTLHTDDQRLKQVINNLLSNAFKFTEKGGITLAIQRPAANEDLSRSGLDPADSIAVSVADTGIGIPADKQKVIFEAFQQADGTTSRRYGGTGLGLSISRQLVQLMGGEIKLHSEKGKGSRFTAYLPERLKPQTDGGSRPSAGSFRPAAAESAPEPAAPAEAALVAEDDRANLKPGDKSILIIEDDRNFSTILAELAHEKDFKCLLAGDGRNGLLLAEKHSPSAVILDIGLPQVDGWTVMEKLKDNPHTRHIPVHFVSGSDHQQEAEKMGAIGYSMKPVSMAELGESFKKIERFISKLIKNLLVITDDKQHRQDILKTVENEQIAITLAGDREEAWRQLGAREYECIILDINLERNAGIEFLERLQTEEPLSRIPVVVYAERDLTQQEEAALLHCASRITVKTVRSPERLLDEASLFLHEVEAKLPKEQQQMLHIAHDKEAILAGKKVLVADDDIRNSFAMGAVLGKKNMNVVLAANGKEALKLLDEQPDIDLVFMDIMMPEMDGYEATRKIRAQARFRKLPVIALTAKAMKEDRTKCIDAGANDYLAKPVDADKLTSLMRVWLYQ